MTTANLSVQMLDKSVKIEIKADDWMAILGKIAQACNQYILDYADNYEVNSSQEYQLMDDISTEINNFTVNAYEDKTKNKIEIKLFKNELTVEIYSNVPIAVLGTLKEAFDNLVVDESDAYKKFAEEFKRLIELVISDYNN
jgi:hypothetical protein